MVCSCAQKAPTARKGVGYCRCRDRVLCCGERVSEKETLVEAKSDKPENSNLFNRNVVHYEHIRTTVLRPAFPPLLQWRCCLDNPSNLLLGSTLKGATRTLGSVIGVGKGPSTCWEAIRICREGVSVDAVVSKDKEIIRSFKSHGFHCAQQAKHQVINKTGFTRICI